MNIHVEIDIHDRFRISDCQHGGCSGCNSPHPTTTTIGCWTRTCLSSANHRRCCSRGDNVAETRRLPMYQSASGLNYNALDR